jgi:carbamoyltransferase
MESWLPILKLFYKSNAEGHNYETFMKVVEAQVNTHLERTEDPLLTFDVNNRFSGQLAYDIAATSQRVFQDCFMEIAEPYLEKYEDLPVCITGGCGLNILLNTFLVEQHNREVFVGPNPNDCGLAAGMLLEQIKPKEPVDLTYSGLPLLDLDAFQYYLDPPSNKISVEKIDIEKLANDIYEGKIIGVARGRAEHGPRALGNRSILCNPSIPDMKDKLNAEVKKREWFRPFAPVVRLEDVNKYFHWDRESRWMSFCPRVREEWKEKLQAITHVDGTARVQTVTREQNEFLYDLITAFEKLNEVGVLLNTSFNVNGKPLVSTVSDAFDILYNTQLSGIVIEDNYVLKI